MRFCLPPLHKWGSWFTMADGTGTWGRECTKCHKIQVHTDR